MEMVEERALGTDTTMALVMTSLGDAPWLHFPRRPPQLVEPNRQ
jgi:hypothetical protein